MDQIYLFALFVVNVLFVDFLPENTGINIVS